MTSPGVGKTCHTSWHPYLSPGAVEIPGVGHRRESSDGVALRSTFTSQLLTQPNEPTPVRVSAAVLRGENDKSPPAQTKGWGPLRVVGGWCRIVFYVRGGGHVLSGQT